MIASSSDFNPFCSKYSQLSSIPSSPERRISGVSPCRRLFEEISTNQNPSGFVVSNSVSSLASLVTPAASSCSNPNPNNSLSNNSNIYLNISNVSKQSPTISAGSFNCLDTTVLTVGNPAVVLSEGIIRGYQRRKSLVALGSSLFMDDLGFLPPKDADYSNENSDSNLSNFNSGDFDGGRKPANRFEDSWNAMTSSDPVVVFSEEVPSSSMIDEIVEEFEDGHEPAEQFGGGNHFQNPHPQHLSFSTPRISDKFFKLKPCSVKKNLFPSSAPNQQQHWNRQILSPAFKNKKLIQPRLPAFESRIAISEMAPNENGLIHHLPCFDSPKDAIKRISVPTLVEVLEGGFSSVYDRLLVVDCRYPFEFDGGHIPTAINVSNPELMSSLLHLDEVTSLHPHTLIIFHCEFSSERAPRMALHVRNLDRHLNKAIYPALYYPEMYILDGGYRAFWQQFGGSCEPPHAYVPMRNPEYREELRHHQRVKHAFRSACHISQHTHQKSRHPVTSGRRTQSLTIDNARKFFNDLLSGGCSNEMRNDNDPANDSDSVNGGMSNDFVSNNPLFPSYTIPLSRSFSSIFPSELSEMDIDEAD